MKTTRSMTGACLFGIAWLTCADMAAADHELIELIPDDALVGFYIERPQRALPPTLMKPLLDAVCADAETARTWLDAIRRVPGPVLFAQLSPPRRDAEDVDMVAAIELRGPEVAFDDLVEKYFLPALCRAFGVDAESVRLDKGESATRVFVRSSDKPVFAYAVKDKVAFGSTRAPLVLRWKRGAWPERRWVDLPGVKKMLGGLAKSVSARVVVNPPALIRLLDKPKANSSEELAYKVFAPEEIQAAALDLNWERTGLHVRGTVALAEDYHGITSVFSRAAGPPKLLGVFPDDFLALGRVAFSSLAGVPRGVYAITDGFDETISAEYREESAEFRQETGVDFENGVLANVVGEAVFGLRVDFTRPSPIGWTAVFSLKDGPGFAEQLEKLIDHFGLSFEQTDVDGVTVRTAVDTYPFAMVIQGDRLILGDVPDTVVEIAGRASKGAGGFPVGPNLRACLASLGDASQFCAMLDIKQLRQRVPMLPLLVGAKFAPLLADGTIGASMTFEERAARLDMHWSFVGAEETARRRQERKESEDTEGAEALVRLAVAVGESISEAREQSKRVVAMSNMRGMGQALYIYAQGHGGAFPDSLSDLLRAVPDAVSLKMLVSPYDGRGPGSISEVEQSSFVIYRPGLSAKSDPAEVVMAEREPHGDGANFLFVDGHVEYVQEPRAGELIELIRDRAEQVRK